MDGYFPYLPWAIDFCLGDMLFLFLFPSWNRIVQNIYMGVFMSILRSRAFKTEFNLISSDLVFSYVIYII